jgi:hypothetical protein
LDYVQGPEGIRPEGIEVSWRVANDRQTLAIIAARFIELLAQDRKELEKPNPRGDKLRVVCHNLNDLMLVQTTGAKRKDWIIKLDGQKSYDLVGLKDSQKDFRSDDDLSLEEFTSEAVA